MLKINLRLCLVLSQCGKWAGPYCRRNHPGSTRFNLWARRCTKVKTSSMPAPHHVSQTTNGEDGCYSHRRSLYSQKDRGFCKYWRVPNDSQGYPTGCRNKTETLPYPTHLRRGTGQMFTEGRCTLCSGIISFLCKIPCLFWYCWDSTLVGLQKSHIAG